jgi:predicted nucleic-acid-binding protein
MLAADTNVVVRLIVADDVTQTRKVRRLFEQNEIFISATVLVETEWVLRGVYRLERSVVLAALRGLAGLPSVRLEEGDRVAQAMDWFERGMDFADALHVTAAVRAEAFVTFDQKLAASARRLDAGPVKLL